MGWCVASANERCSFLTGEQPSGHLRHQLPCKIFLTVLPAHALTLSRSSSSSLLPVNGMRNVIGQLPSTLAKALVTFNFIHFLLGHLLLSTLIRPASSVASEHTWLPDSNMRVLMNSLGNEPSFGQGLESNIMQSESINIRSWNVWEVVNAIDTQVARFSSPVCIY
jgi:hypothetical protein